MSRFVVKYFPLILSTAAASFMVNLDTYIINVSIPAVAADFFVDKADISWVIMSYNLLVVSLLLICGKLADRVGMKKLFLFGFGIFTVSSFFCGISQNLPQLIFSRILQGLGASVLYALPQAITGKFLPVEHRGMGFGLNASAAALGIMLGSPLSGIITGLLSWHWIFFINIPVGIAVIIIILKNSNLFKEENENQNSPFDIKGSILSFFGILLLTFWLNRLNSFGFKNIYMILCILTAVVLITLFVVNCKDDKNSLVDLNLFKNRYFSCANSAMFLISAFLAGHNFIMPFYLSEILKLSEVRTGFLFMVYSAVYMIFSLVYGKISKSVNSARVSVLGAFIGFVSCLSFALISKTTNSVIAVIILFILLGISFSFFITSNNNFVMSLASKENAGAIAGLHRMTGRLGMLFGVAVFEFIYSLSGKSNINGYEAVYLTSAAICLLTVVLSLLCTVNSK